MKYLFIITMALVTALAFGQNVHIPDPALKRHLVDLYDNDDDGEISFTEAEAPTFMNVGGRSISDITGLEAFVNAQFIDIGSNNISDISILMNHTNVRSLDLSFNALETLPDLSGMTMLGWLNLAANNLTEQPDLRNTNVVSMNILLNELTEIDTAKLPANFTSLDFTGNPIQNFPDLSGFTEMRHLGCSSNSPTVEGDLLPSSLVTLYMPFNNTSGWQSFQHLTQLEEWRTYNCDFTGVIDLSPFTNLTLLEISSNQITGLTGIENLNLLTDLDLRFNQITELPSLANNLSLRHLSLDHNQLTALPDLSMLTLLEFLDGSYNMITELPPLPKNAALEIIIFSGNLLTSLPDLADYPLLRTVDASRNLFTDLSDIVVPESISRFDVSYNQLVVPPSVAESDNFRSIYFNWNFLTTLEGLTQSQNTIYIAHHNLLDESSCTWFSNSSNAFNHEQQGHIAYDAWSVGDVSVLDMVQPISGGYTEQAYTITCE